MPAPIPPATLEAFAALAAIVYEGALDVGEAICRTAVRIVPGADHVSISTLEADGRLHTRAASDEVARLMDQLENEAGEGPCIDSIVEDSFQRDEDISDRSTWPALAKLTLERTSVRGMIGYQLLPDQGRPSALNIFSDTAGALTVDSADTGALLAAFASVSLTAAARHKTAEDLRKGLESNREIGKAVGLLMAAHSIDADQAFDLLRSTSSRTNTKLAQVAAQITQGHKAT